MSRTERQLQRQIDAVREELRREKHARDCRWLAFVGAVVGSAVGLALSLWL